MGYPQQPPGYGPPGGGYGGGGGYGPPGGGGYGGYGAPGGGYGGYPPQQPPSSTPQVLSIIGIVCWFCCSPAAIALGLIAQGQYRNQGQSDTLAKVAWIGGVVALLLGIVVTILRFAAMSHSSSTY